MVNVTGWNYLLDGRIIMAARTMYEYYWGDWFMTLLFIVFKIILYFGTRSLALSFITSILFLSVSAIYLDQQAFGLIIAVMVFELAGIMYDAFWKK